MRLAVTTVVFPVACAVPTIVLPTRRLTVAPAVVPATVNAVAVEFVTRSELLTPESVSGVRATEVGGCRVGAAATLKVRT